jgi:hypothetical protein
MAVVPRIARVLPKEPITRPEVSIPVVARLRWASGEDDDVLALAIAWTRQAVQIQWQYQGVTQTDWVDAGDVRRDLAAPVQDPSRPPTSRGSVKKNKW